MIKKIKMEEIKVQIMFIKRARMEDRVILPSLAMLLKRLDTAESTQSPRAAEKSKVPMRAHLNREKKFRKGSHILERNFSSGEPVFCGIHVRIMRKRQRMEYIETKNASVFKSVVMLPPGVAREGGGRLRKRCLFTKAATVFESGACLRKRCLFTKAALFTKAVFVFKSGNCLRKQCLFSKAVLVYENGA